MRVLSTKDGPDMSLVAILNFAIAHTISPSCPPPRTRRHARTAFASTLALSSGRMVRIGPTSSRRLPRMAQSRGDAVQPVEVVHAEVTARVHDQSFVQHADQF